MDHVVLVIFENRSFDNLLGRLYPDRPEFEGMHEGREPGPGLGPPDPPVRRGRGAGLRLLRRGPRPRHAEPGPG